MDVGPAVTLSYSLVQHFAKVTPSARAVATDAGWVTYEEFDYQIRCRARSLLETFPDQGRIPVIVDSAQLHSYVCLMAVSAIGSSYVPIPFDAPDARVSQILVDIGVSTVLDATSQEERVSFALVRQAGVASNEPLQTSGTLDVEAEVYVMFTSGSSGVPKGVPISGRNLSSFLSAFQRRVGITSSDVCLQLSALNFDLSVMSSLLPWSVGAGILPANAKNLLWDARILTETSPSPSVWVSVPSVVSSLRRTGRLQEQLLSDIRMSIFCGEALSLDDAQWWRQISPTSKIFNTYGPTEATVAVTAVEWDGSNKWDPLPLGTPLDGTHVHLRPVSKDEAETRQIILEGAQLFSGYLGSSRARGEERSYATGDLGFRDDEGLIHFAGRIDRQVKVRGYRVELGELESVALSCDGVVEAAALCWGKPQQRLGLVIVGNVESSVVLAQLRQLLPAYAVPSKVVITQQLPRLSSGKQDYGTIVRLFEAGRTSTDNRNPC